MKNSLSAIVAALAGHIPVMADPMMARPMKRHTRTRVPGPRRPSGSKLWRQAQKRRLGVATIR